MSSIPERTLEGYIDEECGARAVRADILAALEPYRESVEYWMGEFDDENQSWRAYRGCVDRQIPAEVRESIDQALAKGGWVHTPSGGAEFQMPKLTMPRTLTINVGDIEAAAKREVLEQVAKLFDDEAKLSNDGVDNYEKLGMWQKGERFQAEMDAWAKAAEMARAFKVAS